MNSWTLSLKCCCGEPEKITQMMSSRLSWTGLLNGFYIYIYIYKNITELNSLYSTIQMSVFNADLFSLWSLCCVFPQFTENPEV